MKAAIAILILIIIGFGAYVLWTPADAPESANEDQQSTEMVTGSEVTSGTYAVVQDQSTVRWAGRKPLIDGYINSGSIAISEGSIDVEDNAATGMFTIDMTTLSVSETPTKPGQESTLTGHLQGENWFNVEAFPTAAFEIVEVMPRADSDTTFVYDVRGNLTMKGQTNEVSFPAMIYLDEAGMLHAEADFEIDRTRWGITAGSGSFFDNLADNAISDMVALSFELVAERQ